MSLLSSKVAKILRLSATVNLTSPSGNVALGVQGSSKLFYSTGIFDSDKDNDDGSDIADVLQKPELQAQSVDPKKGWNYRGVHKAIICGKIGQSPVQKILRNGNSVTIFTVGTGGLYDQRITDKNLPKPAQWHRIAVHNKILEAYAVKQLVKNSPVYVEGDIETRVYNDSISGDVKSIPEICVRRDGQIRVIKTGESVKGISIDELREGLL